MLYFHDIALWERMTDNEKAYTSNFIDIGERDDQGILHSFDATSSALQAEDMKSIIEVVRRVTAVAKQHWYTLEVNMGQRGRTQEEIKLHGDYHAWLPWKKFMNPRELTKFLRRYLFH